MINEIKAGESKTLEFKEILPDDSSKWIKTIIAFANGAGGKLVIGVNNKREIIGLKDDIFELKDKISNIISQMCEPQIIFDINTENIDNKEILVVKIFPANHTPYYIKSSGKENGTYIRLGATTHKADENTINELTYKGQNISYDLLCNNEYKINEKDLKALCDEMSQSSDKKITKKELINLKLIKDDKATNALAIMLGKHKSTSRVQCARFKGISKTHILDKKEYESSLIEQINGAYNFVLNYLQMNIEIKGIFRDEKYEIPQGAIREAIINALVHRNYAISDSVKVAIYDDRVEISSPGALYGSMTLSDLGTRSELRNSILARSLEKIKIIESWGSGIARIKELCAKNGVLEPEFMECGNSFVVIFHRQKSKKSAIKIGDNFLNNKELIDILDKINEPVKKFIDIFKGNKELVKVFKNDAFAELRKNIDNIYNLSKIGDKISLNDDIAKNSKKIGDKKSAIKNQKSAIKIGDKISPNDDISKNSKKIGDKKSAINSRILEFLADNENSKTAQIASFIGLENSRTRELLAELVEQGKVIANGANRNRTYTLKK